MRSVSCAPRFVHSSRPIGHGLVSILVQHLHAQSQLGCEKYYVSRVRPRGVVTVVYGAKNSAVWRKTGLSQHRQPNKIKTNGRCFTVVSTIAACWHIKFRHVSCVHYIENRQELAKLGVNRRVEAGSIPMVSPRYTAMAWPCRWACSSPTMCAEPQIFQRCKSDANKQNFSMK